MIDDYCPTRYSFRVLIGNWNEEKFAKQYETSEFNEARKRNDLILYQKRSLYNTFLEPTELHSPYPYICFGAKVQLCAIDVCRNKNYLDQPLALSLFIDATEILSNQTIGPHCHVSMAPTFRPYARNTFIIRPIDSGTDRTGQPLKYNEEFHLQCITAPDECGRVKPVVLFSTPKISNLHNVPAFPRVTYNKNGEINVAVGVCFLDTDDGVSCNAFPPAYCQWRCLHRIPNERFESEGENVPVSVPPPSYRPH